MSPQSLTLEVISDVLPTEISAGRKLVLHQLPTISVSQDLRTRPVAAQCLQSGCPIAAFVVAARASKASSKL
jgi:hypothetical protein